MKWRSIKALVMFIEPDGDSFSSLEEPGMRDGFRERDLTAQTDVQRQAAEGLADIFQERRTRDDFSAPEIDPGLPGKVHIPNTSRIEDRAKAAGRWHASRSGPASGAEW